jgi:Ser/Thr protein kinase RdoA (MazF antagonist)
LVLDALETLGLETDGRLLALNSYENRVYQVGLDGSAPVIVKFYRPERWSDGAILEEHDFSRELAELEIPAVPPAIFGDRTLHRHEGFRFSVTPRRGGRTPALDDPDVLEWIGRLLGRMHAAGGARPFEQRPTLDIASFGEEPRAYLLANGWLPADLEDAYRSVSEHALTTVRACFERAGAVRLLRLHGDCHLGNMLWTGEGPHFVDFDDTRMGPAIQDLWMLLSGDRTDMVTQLGVLGPNRQKSALAISL